MLYSSFGGGRWQMSFHVYVEPELELQLEELCKKSGKKRNAVVREALREYVTRQNERAWPTAVFHFKPDAKLVRFESTRSDLPLERDGIFSEGQS
jgi:hypothetical protein